MPVSAADRHRLLTGAVAILAIGLGGFGVAYVKEAEAIVSKPLPDFSLETIDSAARPGRDAAGMRPSGNLLDPRDPFAPSERAAAPSRRPAVVNRATPLLNQRWTVSSILFLDSTRSAIVNDVWVSVGDRLAGGERVTEIGRKYVVMTDAKGVRHVIPLRDGQQ